MLRKLITDYDLMAQINAKVSEMMSNGKVCGLGLIRMGE